MKLLKATAVNKEDLYSFAAQYKHLAIPQNLNDKTSYVIEENGSIICFFQLEYVAVNDVWLKKLFIIQQEALKLPNILHTIIQFARKNNIATIYVHSKQLVTDLLLSSFSFTLQLYEQRQTFQLTNRGNWWYYSFSSNEN